MNTRRKKNKSMRNTKKVLLAVVTSLLICLTSDFLIADEITAEKFVFDNGMTLLVKEMPSSPVVALRLLVKTGSTTEGKYLGSGISHFLEHMLFKGTEKRPMGQIAQDVRALGGIINAGTSFDHTIYLIELPYDKFAEGLDILSDMIMNAQIDPQEVAKEREVILNEIRMGKDSPTSELARLIHRTVYKQHPYRHPIIGHEPLFKLLTRDDLVMYYTEKYIPNNIILSIAGNVRMQDVRKKVEEIFKNYTPKPFFLRNLPVEPSQIRSRFVEQEYDTDLARLAVIYPSVRLNNPDLFALDVLAIILGHGKSSRLYLELYEKQGLVFSVSASNYTPVDRGFFAIRCTLDPEKVKDTIEAVKQQIAIIKRKGVSRKELDKAKRQVLSGYLFGRQQAGGIAHSMAINEAFAGDYKFDEQYVAAIQDVSVKDIQKVANKYLIESGLNTVILKPRVPQQKREEQGLYEEPEIKKIQFDNGLTILLREDPTFPLVTIHCVLQGGLRTEDEQNNGIANLMAGVWTKGTKSKTSQDIALTMESLGARLSAFSGRNSFGLAMNLLSEDVKTGIDLIEDVIKNPTFPQKEIEKEKERIRSSILAQNDSILRMTSKRLLKKLFLTHPYRLNPLGTNESLDRITREDIMAQYKELCTPSNMVLAIFGDIKEEEILPILKRKFSELSGNEVTLAAQPEPMPESIREAIEYMDKKQAVVMIGFQGPNINESDRFNIEILTSLLGSSLSGRLFVKVRDELGKAYALGGSYIPGIDMGCIYFYVVTDQEHVQTVKEILKEQIKLVQNDIITDEELSNMKTYLKGTHKMSLETNASLSLSSSLNELYGLGFDYHKKYDEQIERVKKDHVRESAKKYLNLEQMVIAITYPKEDSNK